MIPRTMIVGPCLVTIAVLVHKNQKIRKQNAELSNLLVREAQWFMYFVEMMNRNEVEVTEFDQIVLNNFFQN